MCSYVVFQSSFVHESFPALCAFKRPLFIVNFGMDFYLELVSKCHVAHCALVWSFAKVTFLMYCQPISTREYFAAHLALVCLFNVHRIRMHF